MQRGRSVKRRIMAWVLSLVMVASVIMVPAGKVEAATNEISLTIPSGVQSKTGDSNDNGKVEVDFGKGGMATLDSLRASGVQSLQVKVTVNSVTALNGETPRVQPYINAKNYWKGTQMDIVVGSEVTLTHDLSTASGSGEVWGFGLQFTGVSVINYEITSAKLITDTDSATGNIDNTRSESSGVTADASIIDHTTGWTKYLFALHNNTGNAICDWIIKLRTSRDLSSVFQCWNCRFVAEGNYIYLYPTSNDNAVITGTELSEFVPGGGFSTDLSDGDVVVESVTFNIGSTSTIDYSGTGTSNDDGSGSGGSGVDDYTGSLTYEVPENCVDDMDAADTPFGIHGKLNVNMKTLKITDQNGNPFQLRGISSHGINWQGNNEYEYEYINYQSIKNCRDILNANAIRLAMYTDEYNGYTTGGSPGELKYRVDKGVQCATALGMYAIVDWHILNSNPKAHIEQAKEFWAYASERYKDNDNVLYEICNEPTSGIWSDIKSYAETIIPIIRANDPDAIIIVGTPTWSQDVDIAMNDPLKDSDGTLMDNVMYTIHFYAAEHKDSYRQKMKAAWNTIPIFCTEYGMCAASGDGAYDFDSSKVWLDLMDDHCISYFVWNLSEKTESSSLITHGSNAYNNWTASNLRGSGQWIKEQYTLRKDVNNTIPTGDIEVKEVTFDKSELSLAVGESVTLKASVTPTTASDKTLTWSSSETDIAIVDYTGKITAIKAGTTIITAGSTNGKTATCTVTVKNALTAIELSKASITMEKGDDITISGTGTPGILVTPSPADADLGTITLTSGNTDVVTVNNTTGKITAVGTGATTITVTSGTGEAAKTAELSVKVVLTPTGIELTGETLEDNKLALETTGDVSSAQLTAVISPVGATVAASDIVWAVTTGDAVSVTKDSNDPTKATVKAVKKGTAVITVSITGTTLSATCNVTVTVPVESITLDKTSLTLITTDDAKSTAALTPTISPADADGVSLKWKSSKPEVATVDTNGVVTAVGDGTTTITVATESGSKSATCEVTVVDPIQSVKITDVDGTEITDRAMAIYAEETVKALVNPSGATGRDIVNWSVTSGKDVVSLEGIEGSHDVKVKALKTGTAAVKVTVGEDIGEGVDKIPNVKEATFNITVSNIIKDVTLTDNESKTFKTMTIGDTVSLNAVYDPAADTDEPYSVEWKSSDEAAVSVNVVDDTDKKLATVTALKSTAGEEVTITLTVVPAENAKAIVKEYKVIVRKKTQEPPADISIGVSERTANSITVNATPDAAGKTYQYSFDAGESWQDESKATGLNEATAYNVKIRYKETDDFEASEPTAATLKVGTLLSVTTPYTIDVSRLPGGANYTDDTYVNALYISDNGSGKEPSATYEDGKLTLLPGRDYKLSGSNDSLTISYKQDETASGTSSEDNTTVTLDNAAIKTVDAQATIKISGKTTVDGDIKADKVDVTDGAEEIKVSGDVDADTVNVAAGTGEVSVAGKVSADKVSVSSGTVKVDDGIKAASEVAITGGTVEATGDKDTAAIEAAAVSISGGSVTATGTEGGAAIKGDTVTVSGGDVTATGKDEGSAAITGATVELSGGTVAATAGAGAAAIEGTDAVTIGSSVKLSVNSSKKSDGTVVAVINSKAITIDENADIKADDNAKTNLFSVTPKDTNGVAVDVTKYIGKTEDVSQPKGDENKSTTPAGQSDGGDQTSQPIKATDMIITAGVKGVTGVTLSGTYQLALKKTLTVAVAFSPENAVNESVTVTSSNPKVVAVSGTKLTAKKAGTAKITVTSENGLTKTFSVKVMKKSVSKVKLKASKKTVKVGKTLKLKATTSPSKKKASNKLYWSSSDDSIATVTQKGAVKGVKKGKVKITATALDGSGKKATLKITVK